MIKEMFTETEKQRLQKAYTIWEELHSNISFFEYLRLYGW